MHYIYIYIYNMCIYIYIYTYMCIRTHNCINPSSPPHPSRHIFGPPANQHLARIPRQTRIHALSSKSHFGRAA